MTHEPSFDAELMRLSEDSAHRLLARAIELDNTRGSETTLADLRAIASEAGISAQAFDAAFREFSAMADADTVGLPGRVQLTGPETPPIFTFDLQVAHPLGAEQRTGVYPERVVEWLATHIH